MKSRSLIIGLLFFVLTTAQVFAQTAQKSTTQDAPASDTTGNPVQSSASAEPKIDPAKEAAIRKLIAVSHAMDAANQAMDGMQNNIRPMLSNAFPPGDYRDKLIDLFFQKVRGKMDMHHLEDLTVRAYDKYFTEEEINGLTQFYSTPIGQKVIVSLPKLTVELQTEGMKWGQDIGRQSMVEVMSEHPELKQAMEDAVKKKQQQ